LDPLVSDAFPTQARCTAYLSPSTRIRSPYILSVASRARMPRVPVIKMTMTMKMTVRIVATVTASHSFSVRRVSARPVRRSSSSCLPYATTRSVKMHQTAMTKAQTTLAIPTQPSSSLMRGTARIRIMSIAKSPAMMAVVMRRPLAGVTKKMVATRRLPRVRHV